MSKELDEKFVSDDGVSTPAEPTTPEGGVAGKRNGDVHKKVDPKHEKVADGVNKVTESEENDDEDDEDEEDEKSVAESVASLFDGETLSEGFKDKAVMVFEAAVNEAASAKAAALSEAMEEEFATKLEESVSAQMDEIVENLDNYLDYIVNEWMSENELAIESGIKVEMAESFMEGLKGLFYEHNVEIDENTIDVVSDLEAQLESTTSKTNNLINENIELIEEIKSMKAEKVFADICEDLTTSKKERMKILSEKINHDDLDAYATDLKTLKNSFFKESVVAAENDQDEANEVITESTAPKTRSSEYDSVNAYVAAIDARNK